MIQKPESDKSDVIVNGMTLGNDPLRLEGNTIVLIHDMYFQVVSTTQHLPQLVTSSKSCSTDSTFESQVSTISPLRKRQRVEDSQKPTSLKDFRCGKRLGHGLQGGVYMYRCPKAGTPLAVKVMDHEDTPEGRQLWPCMCREPSIPPTLQHVSFNH